MKYCSKCGKQLFDEAVICPGCGCSTAPQAPVQQTYGTSYEETQRKESPSKATSAMVFAFLIPILGLILGIVGAATYRTPEYRKKSVAAIFVSIGVWILSIAILVGLMSY